MQYALLSVEHQQKWQFIDSMPVDNCMCRYDGERCAMTSIVIGNVDRLGLTEHSISNDTATDR